jgi:hypothetical protein
MSSSLQLLEQTHFRNEGCYKDSQNYYNSKIFNHQFLPSIEKEKKSKNVSRKKYLESTSIYGVMQDNNYDKKGELIMESTKMRNGEIYYNMEDKKELDTRLFIGCPLMTTGQSILENPDLSSRLLYGEETRTPKSINSVSAYSADNFIPLIKPISDNIQNTEHIIPTYWVRGGMSTRTVVRNIDYMKSCGKK